MKRFAAWWRGLSIARKVVVVMTIPVTAGPMWAGWYGTYVSREPGLTAVLGDFSLWYEGKATGCLPWSFYLGQARRGLRSAVPTDIKRGDLLVFRSKGALPIFPDGTFLFKFVAGTPGDHILIDRDQVYINGVRWGGLHAYLRKADLPAGHFDRDFIVPPGELFMLGTEERTFDGRYWGTIKYEQIIARLALLG